MKDFLKYFSIGVSFFMIVLIACCIFLQPEHKKINIGLKAKSIKTTTFAKAVEVHTEEVPKEEPVVEVVEEEPAPVAAAPQLEVVETPSIDTQVGVMSAYGPDCVGCSGYLSNGHYAGDGNIYYEDPTYGTVRIVAGDRQYPIGSIVKVSGSALGDFNAIVLDRGGGIGFGKRFLFDLLFSSEAEASQFGTSYNVTFDLLRSGY